MDLAGADNGKRASDILRLDFRAVASEVDQRRKDVRKGSLAFFDDDIVDERKFSGIANVGITITVDVWPASYDKNVGIKTAGETRDAVIEFGVPEIIRQSEHIRTGRTQLVEQDVRVLEEPVIVCRVSRLSECCNARNIVRDRVRVQPSRTMYCVSQKDEHPQRPKS